MFGEKLLILFAVFLVFVLVGNLVGVLYSVELIRENMEKQVMLRWYLLVGMSSGRLGIWDRYYLGKNIRYLEVQLSVLVKALGPLFDKRFFRWEGWFGY